MFILQVCSYNHLFSQITWPKGLTSPQKLQFLPPSDHVNEIQTLAVSIFAWIKLPSSHFFLIHRHCALLPLYSLSPISSLLLWSPLDLNMHTSGSLSLPSLQSHQHILDSFSLSSLHLCAHTHMHSTPSFSGFPMLLAHWSTQPAPSLPGPQPNPHLRLLSLPT